MDKLYFLLVLLLLVGFTSAAHADDAPPPTRAARLTSLQGTVTVTQPGETDVIPAQLNLPLLSGVLLTTGDDGKAEVEFEDGSIVRLTPNSALSLESLTLDPNGVATSSLRLEHGVAFVELRATDLYKYTFSAGDDLLRPVENSTVRVDFDTPPPVFSVLAGSIRIEGPEGLQADVRAGENLRPDLDDPGQYHRNQGIVQDTWNQWNQDMDQSAAAQADSSTPVRNDYAGQQGYGWSDLDANGTWYDTGSGPVWQPYGADNAAFDPYANGSWVAYSTVGYVWASAYPWGWTPYRCGNWSYYGRFGWGWAPGSSCGTIGWRFQVGGRPVNIARAPESYRPIRVPSPGHGVQRPLLRVQPGSATIAAGTRHDDHRGPRQISGLTVTPIQPIQTGSGWRNTGAASALHRDYPVDARTRQPVAGVVSTRPASVRTWPSQAPTPATAARPAAPVNASRPADHPVYGVQYRPGQPETAPAQNGTSAERDAAREQRRNATAPPPMQTYSPATGTAAPQQPTYTLPSTIVGGRQTHPTYAPPPSTVTGTPMHPTYTPPPSIVGGSQTHPIYTPPPPATTQTRPIYTPPPAAVAPMQHPTYSPPPQAPAQIHSTYSPPPPASAPRASSPPPSSGGEPAAGARVGGRR